MNLDAPSLPLISTGASPNDVTLSNAIAALRQQLKDAFEPALQGRGARSKTDSARNKYDPTLLHPLSVTNTEQIQLPYELLSNSLASFENNLLNSGSATTAGAINPDGTPILPAVSSAVSTNEKLRLLALMKEQSALNLQDLLLKDGIEVSRKIIERRRNYTEAFPVHIKGNVQSILEGIAKACGLEIFAGAEEGAPGDEGGLGDAMDTDMDGTSSSMRKSTVTMAGKGMVLDFDIELPAGTAIEALALGQVTGVRFSYGMEGSTDTGIDRLLSRQAKNAQWEAFRGSLMTLARLDSLITVQSDSQTQSQETVLDPFGAMKSLGLRVESLFKSELEVASSPHYLFTTGHGLPILNQDTPYLTLIYHLPALAFFAPEWEEAVASGFQNEQIAKLVSLEGVKSIRFKVEQKSTAQAPSSLTAGEASFPLLKTPSSVGGVPEGLQEGLGYGITMVAKLSEPVWISRATGRKLQAILSGQPLDPAPIATSIASISSLPSLESYILSSIAPGNIYESTVSGCAPIRNTLSSLAGSQAYQIREFRFSTAGQLLASMEVLRTQNLINELLVNTFGEAGIEVERQDEGNIRLEDLFSDAPQPYISLSVQASLAEYPPSLHASFSLPNLPGWLPVTLQLEITSDQSRHSGFRLSYTVQGCHNDALQERVIETLTGDAGEDKMEAVLAKSRDVRMMIRWIGMRMQKSGQDVWKGIAEKPVWTM